ncbi:fructose-6-phosphate aldolase [Virgibacillus halodenitrificans]|nr:fructose-6-phosphate aldolase [Virgibacillus halodenitrificans]
MKTMEIYLDTANDEEVKFAARYGFLDGVTTNPSIISREKEEFQQVIQRIDRTIDGKVWCQVTEENAETMYKQGLEMNQWAKNAVIKLPMNENGLEAAYRLRQEHVEVNMTLIYSLSQVVLAAKAGVTYISPYIGRMDDHVLDGQLFIRKAKEIIHACHSDTKIIGASIRSPQVVVELARDGYDAVTMAFPVYKKMFHSSLTVEGLEQFHNDWASYEHRSL